jgi:hemerythrin
MQWKDEYSIGIEEIDKQHRVLLDCFTLIEDSIALNESWTNVHFAVVELREFARIHFAVEETLMRMFNFPDAEPHAKAHQGFFARLQEIEQKSLRVNASEEMATFLRDWLVKHICTADRGYAEHIRHCTVVPA